MWLANFCLIFCLGGLGLYGRNVIDRSNRQFLKLLGLSQWRQLIFTKHVAILLLNFIPAVTNGMNLFVWKFSTIIIQYFVHNFSFNDKSRASSNPFLLKWLLTLKTVVFYEFILQLRTPHLHLRLATKAWNSSDSFYFLVFNLCYFNKHHSFKQFFFENKETFTRFCQESNSVIWTMYNGWIAKRSNFFLLYCFSSS